MEHTEVLRESSETLKKCGGVLGRACVTCCIPERSVLFKVALDKLRNALFELQFGQKTPDVLRGCIAEIKECGGMVGELYATCCTPSRTCIYGDILDKLNKVISDLGGIIYEIEQAGQPQAQ